MIDELHFNNIETTSQTLTDKINVDTGNSELNKLMNGNMFSEKSISSDSWKKYDFKDNLVSNLKAAVKKGSYIDTASGSNMNVNVSWKDRFGDVGIPNIDLISKGINADIYPKAIYEFYNYSVNAIYHIYEAATGFIFDTYQKFLNIKSNFSEEQYKKIINNARKSDCISGFNKEYILPYSDMKTSSNDELVEDSNNYKIAEFIEFLDTIRGNKYTSVYGLLNPDEYVNVVSALRNEITFTGSGDLEESSAIINLDIQNNNYDLSMLRSSSRYTGGSVSLQIVPYIINILHDSNDSINNGMPLVGYNVYISFDTVCDSILSSVKYVVSDKIPTDNKKEFIATILNSEILTKRKIHEKIANSISLFLFNSIHKVFNNFGNFINLSESYYDKLVNEDYIISNIIDKVKYCLPDTTKLSLDSTIKDAIKSAIKTYGDICIRPENMLYDLNEISQIPDNKEQITRLVYLIYARAFSMLNEDSFIVDGWDDTYSTTGFVKSELITYINGIDDYFIKDFFTNLYNTVGVSDLNCDFSYLVSDNERSGLNGELITKKYHRSIHHFYMVLGMIVNIYGNLTLNIRDIDAENYTSKNMKTMIYKLKYKMNSELSDILKGTIKQLTLPYINPAATLYPYDNKIGNYSSTYMVQYADNIIRFLTKYDSYLKSRRNSDFYNIHETIRKTLKSLNAKTILKPHGEIFGYNTPEIAEMFLGIDAEKYVNRKATMGSMSELNGRIADNFVKSGMIALENATANYF